MKNFDDILQKIIRGGDCEGMETVVDGEKRTVQNIICARREIDGFTSVLHERFKWPEQVIDEVRRFCMTELQQLAEAAIARANDDCKKLKERCDELQGQLYDLGEAREEGLVV